MRLLILRHAEAVSGADLDAMRALTPFGQQQAAALQPRLGELLGDQYRLLSSPWCRAYATAETLAAGREVVSDPALTPLGTPREVAQLLEPLFASTQPLVLVTHQPLCGRLIQWLCDGRDQPLGLAPCSGALLELDWPAAGMARLLRWLDSH